MCVDNRWQHALHISHANDSIFDAGPAAGWRVSTDLDANYLYVTTRQMAAEAACPDGVAGGYDRDRDADFDDSFSVECHSEIVQVPCCLSVSVNATRSGLGNLRRNAGWSIRVYTLHLDGIKQQKAVYNLLGHPVIIMNDDCCEADK